MASYRETANLEAAYRTDLNRGEVGIVEKKAARTLREFAPRFLAFVRTENAQKPATVAFYEAKLSYLLRDKALAQARLDAIDEAAIASFKQRRSGVASRRGTALSTASVNRELATLRKLLRLAQEWHVVDRVPRIRMLQGERGSEFVFSKADERLYLAASERYYPDLHDFAELSLSTGLRIGECLKLSWPELHLEPTGNALHGHITIGRRTTKSDRERHVPLTEEAVATLRRRGPAKTGLVFRHPDGSPLYQTYLNQQHAEIQALLKLPSDCVPHSFRHTYGTRLGESGAGAFEIMRLMGHSNVTVSQRYVHPTPEALDRAVSRLEVYNRGNGGATTGATAGFQDPAGREQVH